MNVYDFDQTIFHPDSSYAFFTYCLKHFPREVMQETGQKIKAIFSFFTGGDSANAAPLKESLFSFLAYLPEVKTVVDAFWKENEKNIAPWYLEQKKPDDLIISASPEFLLRPICEKLGVSLIATPMDPATGHILGLNCHDHEKVRRFRAEYPDAVIDSFYSDSLCDAPLAEIAQKAFFVKKDKILPWPEK
ncbi:MAG: haloacid dehalogenase-like hydrolase [Lachnospiraceae bacterium]|nr:haloacid dehalogenase-like hydrolase [Lachnospiraceae bacterium]